MACTPPQADSIAALQQLRQEVEERGDECLAMLLGGVEMYVSVGREWELLETMRTFAHDAEEMVHNTPSASELERLYDRHDEQPRG
jgi:hypothetical protein